MPDSHYQNLRDNEITLHEIWGVTTRHRFLVISFPVIAIVIALIVTSVLKPQWEAVALIRIGQIGSKQQLIEPTARAIERIKLEDFKISVLSKLGLPTNRENAESELYLDKLKIEVAAASDLIRITTRGHSPEQAKQFAEATLSTIAEQHAELAEPSIKRLTEHIRQLRKELALETSQQEIAKRALAKNLDSQDKFMANVVLANAIYQRDEGIRSLKSELQNSEEQLDPLKTYPTSFLQGVYVTDKPVMPAIKWIIPLAGIFGLLAGLFIAFLLHGLRTPNRESTVAVALK
ncbi:MAG: Wzz/FepE/Etk N-terminal domain-containing protein [Sideroxydans sp.]